MDKVFIGLGSNLGDRMSYLKDAVKEISKFAVIKKCSSIYETEPWGYKEQRLFLNCVIEIETKHEPLNLLKEVRKIETGLGRVERKKWTEREIDIDILFYGNLTFENDDVKIPHPEIQNRKFVLEPMSEIEPGFIHPVLKKNIANLFRNTVDNSKVIEYNRS